MLAQVILAQAEHREIVDGCLEQVGLEWRDPRREKRLPVARVTCLPMTTPMMS
jgi:hypothetical protein